MVEDKVKEAGNKTDQGDNEVPMVCEREGLVKSSRELEGSLTSLCKGEVTTASAMTVSQQVSLYPNCSGPIRRSRK